MNAHIKITAAPDDYRREVYIKHYAKIDNFHFNYGRLMSHYQENFRCSGPQYQCGKRNIYQTEIDRLPAEVGAAPKLTSTVALAYESTNRSDHTQCKACRYKCRYTRRHYRCKRARPKMRDHITIHELHDRKRYKRHHHRSSQPKYIK